MIYAVCKFSYFCLWYLKSLYVNDSEIIFCNNVKMFMILMFSICINVIMIHIVIILGPVVQN